MAKETISARYQVKDENSNAVLDADGKPVWQEADVTFDFGDDLDQAVALCGAESVYSNYKANATVALQGIIRAKLKSGMTTDQIQAIVDAWKPGTVLGKTGHLGRSAVIISDLLGTARNRRGLTALSGYFAHSD